MKVVRKGEIPFPWVGHFMCNTCGTIVEVEPADRLTALGDLPPKNNGPHEIPSYDQFQLQCVVCGELRMYDRLPANSRVWTDRPDEDPDMRDVLDRHGWLVS